jgi:hypothetical protein
VCVGVDVCRVCDVRLVGRLLVESSHGLVDYWFTYWLGLIGTAREAHLYIHGMCAGVRAFGGPIG